MKDRGFFNRTKGKTLLTLSLNLEHGWCTHMVSGQKCFVMTSSEIYLNSGLSPASLKSSLPRWCKWELIGRVPVEFNGKPVFGYFLLDRGKRWLNEYAANCLDVDGFTKEISAWRGGLD